MIRRTLLSRCLAALSGGLLAPLSGCEGRARFHLNIDSRESRPPVAPARPLILPPGRTTHLTIVWQDTPEATAKADTLRAWLAAGMPLTTPSGFYCPPSLARAPAIAQVGQPGHPALAFYWGGSGPAEAAS
jgi:hypothetical protein